MLGGGGDEVSTIPIFYPRGMVSVSSLGSFPSVGSSSKPSHNSLPLSLVVHYIQYYLKKKMERKQKYINPQEDKARHEEQKKKMWVKVQAKSVFCYWELVPMESGADNSSEQDTSTVTKELKEPSAKQKCTLWCKEENCKSMNTDKERQGNPAVNGVCDAAWLELGEDPITQQTGTNFCKGLASRKSHTRMNTTR